MSRLISSNIYYPFIPGEPDHAPVAGIREAVFNIDERGFPGPAVADDQLFVSLHSIESTTTSIIMIFRSYIAEKSVYYVNDIIFRINKAEGLGSVRSDNGKSFLFLDYSGLDFSNNYQTFGDSVYILEPCCIRWRYASVSSVIFVNEQRISDVSARSNLSNTILKRFDSPSSIRLVDGYNVSLQYENNTLGLLANPGAGIGVAPYNPWEDKAPPVYEQPLVTINGQLPDDNGDIGVESSESISINKTGNTLIVIDNSHGGE